MLDILYFTAEWCGPCRVMGPLMDDISREHPEVSIQKIDADRNKQLLQQHNVRSIPTFIFIKDGKEVDRIIGARAKTSIKQTINSSL